MKEIVYLVLLVALVLVAIVFGPLLFLWSLNTLFSLGIAYTFWTWLASLILLSFITAPKSK